MAELFEYIKNDCQEWESTIITKLYFQYPTGIDVLPPQLRQHHDQYIHTVGPDPKDLKDRGYLIYILTDHEDGVFNFHIGWSIYNDECDECVVHLTEEIEMNEQDCLYYLDNFMKLPMNDWYSEIY